MSTSPKSIWDTNVKPITVTVEYRCCVPNCGVVERTEQYGGHDYEFFIANKPEKWREYFGALVCPKHTAYVRIDTGEEFTL